MQPVLVWVLRREIGVVPGYLIDVYPKISINSPAVYLVCGIKNPGSGEIFTGHTVHDKKQKIMISIPTGNSTQRV